MAKKYDKKDIAEEINKRIEAATKAQKEKYQAYTEATADVDVLETALESLTGKSKEPAKPSRVGKALGIVGRELNPLRGFSKDYFAAEMKNMMTFNTPVLTSVAEALFFDHDEDYTPVKVEAEQAKAKQEKEAKLTLYEKRLKEEQTRRIAVGLEEDPEKVAKQTATIINIPTPNVAKEQQPSAPTKVENNITVAPKVEIKEPKQKRVSVKGGGDYNFFDYADKNFLASIKESVDTAEKQLKALDAIKKNTSKSAFLGEAKKLPTPANMNIAGEPVGNKSVEGEGDVSRFGHVAKKFTDTFKIFTNIFSVKAKATEKGLAEATDDTIKASKKFGFSLGQIANGLGKGALLVAKWALVALAINHLLYSFKVAWDEGMKVYNETGSTGQAITEGLLKFADVITFGLLSKKNMAKWADTMTQAVDLAFGKFVKGIIDAVDYVITGKFLRDEHTKEKTKANELKEQSYTDKDFEQAKENRKRFLKAQKENKPQASIVPDNSVQTATALSQASTQTSPAMQNATTSAAQQSGGNATVINNVSSNTSTVMETVPIPHNQDIGIINNKNATHAFAGGF